MEYLGLIYYENHQYKKAVKFFQDELLYVEKLFSRSHPSYASAIYYLSHAYAGLRDYRLAESNLSYYLDLHKKGFLQSLDFMTEKERESYWVLTGRIVFEKELPQFVYQHHASDMPFAQIGFNSELFLKGALQQSADIVKRSVENSNNPELIKQWNTLQELRKTITMMEDQGLESPFLE